MAITNQTPKNLYGHEAWISLPQPVFPSNYMKLMTVKQRKCALTDITFATPPLPPRIHRHTNGDTELDISKPPCQLQKLTWRAQTAIAYFNSFMDSMRRTKLPTENSRIKTDPSKQAHCRCQLSVSHIKHWTASKVGTDRLETYYCYKVSFAWHWTLR